MNKGYAGVEQAIADISDGSVIAIGSFFTAGVPGSLLEALAAKKVINLILACGSGPLLGAKEAANAMIANKQIRKIIDSYP
jgi:acyl CoA:acetate/3-ketoacid CoA transferase alpha subunit